MNKRFVSIRWKLVSTYLLLVLLALFTINILISASLTSYLLEQKKRNLLNQGTIVSDQIAPSIENIRDVQRLADADTTIKNLSLRIDARALVISKFGEVIADSYDDYKGAHLADLYEVGRALQGISTARLYEFEEFGQTIYAAVPIYSEGEVTGALLTSASPADVYKQINQILDDFYRLAFVVVLITILTSIVFTDIFAIPIVDLTRVVKNVSSGKMDDYAKVYRHDELGVLAESTNYMIKRLRRVDEMRKKFVSNVSHELRTPLTSLKIIADTLMQTKPHDIAIYQDFMVDISGEIDRLNHIIDTLLTMTKLEQEELTLERHSEDIDLLLKQCIGTMQPIAQQKNIAIEYGAATQVYVLCDALKLRQAVINLINNAIKYSPSGALIAIELNVQRQYVVIKIRDNGIGIPPQDLPHIFDRFYRVDSARSRDTGGSGLGLSITKQIVVRHGGRIEVQSQVGVGTEFSVILPREKVKS